MTSPGGRIPSERLLERYLRAGLIQGVELVQAELERALFEVATRIKCRGLVVPTPKLHDVETSSVDEAGGRRPNDPPSKGRRSTSFKATKAGG